MDKQMTDAALVKAVAERIMDAKSKRSTLPRMRGYTDTWDVVDVHGKTHYLLIHSPESVYLTKLEGWNPLASDSDCFMVVDALLAERCCGFLIDFWWTEKQWSAAFTPDEPGPVATASDPDRRRAILLAAMTAVEGRENV